jgi:hypothetical protein
MNPNASVIDSPGAERDSARLVVSASMNADIPAHYGDWFMARVDAGYCEIPRFDGIGYRRVGLAPDQVAGFVFWTRCVDVFMPHLVELRARGFAFSIQFAITGRGPPHGPCPVPIETAVDQIARLTTAFGAKVAVWRYDPLALTTDTPASWHATTFLRIARMLSGAIDEVVVAWAEPRRQAGSAPRRADAVPIDDERRALMKDMVAGARDAGLRLTLCCEPDALVPGASPARCVDAMRLAKLGAPTTDLPTAGFRPGCLCARSVDIGDRADGRGRIFCGAVRLPHRWPKRGPEEALLFPPRQIFASARADDLPF